MDDLISRQHAIDVIDKIFPADPMRNDYTQGITCGAALATEYIKQMPSAQQWIPCSERLPSMGERVVVSAVHHKTEDVVIDILRYHGKKYGWEFKDICTPVAWMPLPEIYKEEEK